MAYLVNNMICHVGVVRVKPGLPGASACFAATGSCVIYTYNIIILVAFKGAIRDCLQHVCSSGPGRNRVQITCNTSSAYHVQHVVLRATW